MMQPPSHLGLAVMVFALLIAADLLISHMHEVELCKVNIYKKFIFRAESLHSTCTEYSIMI
jgi:hypothetical protein